MSTFTCACGSVTRQPDQATGVLYSLEELARIDVSVAKQIIEFMNATNAAKRESWLQSYFGPTYPADAPERAVLEDIVSRELNGALTPVFECPACGRIALGPEWRFYTPDR